MTASAATFAAAAEALVGAPFRLHGRSPEFGLDCVGLVHHALSSAGGTLRRLPPYNLRNQFHEFVPIIAQSSGFKSVSDTVRRGDVLVVCPGPGQLHLLVCTATNAVVHAHAGLRRVVAMSRPSGWPTLYHFRLSEKN